MSTLSPSSLLFLTTLFVICLGTLAYARALHSHPGVPDLSSVLGNNSNEGMSVKLDMNVEKKNDVNSGWLIVE